MRELRIDLAKIPIAVLARIQEYGADTGGQRIPSRRYFQQSRIKVKKDFKQQSGQFIKSVINTGSEKGLNEIGIKTKQSFEDSVKLQNFKKLHELTIEKKGHGFQWEDSGQMLSAFTYKIIQTNIDKKRSK